MLPEFAKLYKTDDDIKIKSELTADLVGDYLFTDKNLIESLTANPINKRKGRSVVSKIASLYSKTDAYGNNNIVSYITNQINQGNLIDASTKKAPTWFTARGLQLPEAVQTIIDANNSIPQNSEKSSGLEKTQSCEKNRRHLK